MGGRQIELTDEEIGLINQMPALYRQLERLLNTSEQTIEDLNEVVFGNEKKGIKSFKDRLFIMEDNQEKILTKLSHLEEQNSRKMGFAAGVASVITLLGVGLVKLIIYLFAR